MLRIFSCLIAAILALHTLGALAVDTDTIAMPFSPGSVHEVAVDSAGNRYYAGASSGTRDFNPNAGLDVQTFNGSFITRINADGSYGWTKTLDYGAFALNGAMVAFGDKLYFAGPMNGSLNYAGQPLPVTFPGSRSVVIAIDTSTGLLVPSFGTGGVAVIVPPSPTASTNPCHAIVADGTRLFFSSNIPGLRSIGAGPDPEYVLALDRVTGALDTGFGTNGAQLVSRAALGLALTSNAVYAAGTFFSPSMPGINGAGTITGVPGNNGFVMALDRITGAALSGFKTDGTLAVAGSGFVKLYDIAALNGRVFLAGGTTDATLNIGGTAVPLPAGQGGFVIALDGANGGVAAGFGSQGIQTAGTACQRVVGVASTLYLGGLFDGRFTGVGGRESVWRLGTFDTFVAAVDAADGAPRPGFGSNGIQVFGSDSSTDTCNDLASNGVCVLLGGTSSGKSFGVGQLGYGGVQTGYAVPFDAATARSFPHLTSPRHAAAALDAPFHYTFAATQTPVTFSVENLPPQLTFDGTSLQGTISAGGPFDITVRTSNEFGTETTTLKISVILNAIDPSSPPMMPGSIAAIAVDPAGNRYTLGTFSGPLDFDLSSGVDARGSTLGRDSSSATFDVFLTRINADGSYGWTRTFGGYGYEMAFSISVTGSAAYVVGYGVAYGGGHDGFDRIPNDLFNANFVWALNTADGSPLASFGQLGTLLFGGVQAEKCSALTPDGSTLFVSTFYSPSPIRGNSATFPFNSQYHVLALDAVSGQVRTGFGSGGAQLIYTDTIAAMTTVGNGLYVAGSFRIATNPGIGGPGTLTVRGGSGEDAIVAGLDATTGAALPGFGTGGIRVFGGSSFETAHDIATDGTRLFVTGVFNSTDAGLGSATNISATLATSGFPSDDYFLLSLNPATGAGVAGFGTGGVRVIGGTGDEADPSITATASGLYLSGETGSNTRVGAQLTHSAGVLVYGLSPTTGVLRPEFGNGGYHIVTSSNTFYSADGIGSGGGAVYFAASLSGNISFDGKAAFSTGFFADTGVFGVSETGGTLPFILQPATLRLGINEPVSAQIVTAVPADSHSAISLPSTLSVTTAGAIVGNMPPTPGFVSATLIATNKFGSASKGYGIQTFGDQVATTYPPLMRGRVTGATVDSQGNRYVSGTLESTDDDFNPGVGANYKTSISRAAFVTRFNADGSYGWSQVFYGSSQEEGLDVSVLNGTVYLAGSMSSSDAGIGGPGAADAVGSTDAFVLALNAATGATVTGFGVNGVTWFGGSGSDLARAVAATPSAIYVVGEFNSPNAGFNGPGSRATNGNPDAFIWALDPATGLAVPGFGTGGLQTFGGTGIDGAYNVVANANAVWVSGRFASANAGVGGPGSFQAVGQDGFILCLNPTTGAAIPAFGSGLKTISGTGTTTARGLLLDGGTIYSAGDFTSSALSLGGSGPAIASLGSSDGFIAAVDATTGVARAGFGSSGLVRFGGSSSDALSGMAINGGTLYVGGSFNGVLASINGGPNISSRGGSDAVLLSIDPGTGIPRSGFFRGGVLNFGGEFTDSATDVIAAGGMTYLCGNTFGSVGTGASGVMASANEFLGFMLPITTTGGTLPTITSPLTRLIQKDVPFNYTITADSPLTSVGATNLPPGLTETGGVISGTPTQVGSYTVRLTAGNALGTVSADLQIVVVADGVATSPPVIQGASRAVAVDAAGNRFVVGSFSGAVDFNPFPGVDLRKSAGGTDAYVTRYSPDGQYVWTRTMGGISNDAANAISISNGTLYIAGEYVGNGFQFNGGPFFSGVGSTTDGFIVALDAESGDPRATFGNGTFQRIGTSGVDTARTIVATGSVIYVGGTFDGSVIGMFQADLGVTYSGGTGDGFIFALDPASGQPLPAFSTDGIQTFAGTGFDSITCLELGGARLYAGGTFVSPNARIGGAGTSVASAGGNDGFVFALDAATGSADTTFGIRRAGGSSSDRVNDLVALGSTLYAAGTFQSTTLTASTGGTLTNAGVSDGYVWALNSTSGAAVSAFAPNGLKQLGSAGADTAQGITVVGQTIYVCGTFEGTLLNRTGGTPDLYIGAFDATNGQPVAAFGGGLVALAGKGNDSASGIAAAGGRLFVTGDSTSNDVKFNSVGTFNFEGFNGVLLLVDAAQGKFVPTISWAAPAPIPVGTPLSATQLNATTPISGNFAYTPSAGTVLPFGNGHVLSTTFTPFAGLDCMPASATTTIDVVKGTPPVTWTNPSPITYLTALSTVQLNASSTVGGTFVYTPLAGTVLAAGDHVLSTTFTPANGAQYETVTVTAQITVLKASQTIGFPEIASTPVGDVVSLSATATSGLAVGFEVVSGPAALSNGTKLTLTATGPVTIRAIQPGNANFTAAPPVLRTFEVVRRIPDVTWAAPASIVYGTPLGAQQLNATSPVPGTLTYTPTAGAILPAGLRSLSVVFQPLDTVTYQPRTVSVQFTVARAPATVVFSNLIQTADGTPKPIGVQTAPAGLPFSVTYNGLTPVPSLPGTYEVVVEISDLNFAGSGRDRLKIVLPPAFSSAIGATPNPASIGTRVTISAPASDTVSWAWNFGDGVTETTSLPSVEHKFTAAGTFRVSVNATGPAGATVTASTDVVVLDAVDTDGDGQADAADIDDDGDGYSDAIEAASGSDPLLGEDTPFDFPANMPATPFAVQKTSISLNFSTAGKDKISVKGELPLSAAVAVVGAMGVVDIGGAINTFTLDAKGKFKGSSGTGAFKTKKGQLVGVGAFQLALKGSFAAALADEGLTGAATVKGVERRIKIVILFNGTRYGADVTVTYAAKAGKSGSAK